MLLWLIFQQWTSISLRKRRKKTWLRPKGYTHFDSKISGKRHEAFVRSYVMNPTSVGKHAFYPLIHRTIKQRRFKNVKDASGDFRRAHQYWSNGELKSTAKSREIYYAAHLDSQIYSYYAQEVLARRYELLLSANPPLSACICAYRRIPSAQKGRNKYNVHFAKEVFDFIKSTDECVAFAFDVSQFFDSLNHDYLKKAWCGLMNCARLPQDHFNIYKSLTKFSFVEFSAILHEFGIQHENELRRDSIRTFCNTSSEFRNRIRGKGLIKMNPFRNARGIVIGIPQGTALSAFLANLYLLEFDKKLFDVVVSTHGGLYRRYSDDIVVVCPQKSAAEIEALVLASIRDFHLKIQPDKTEKSTFKKNGMGTLLADKPFRYLGFEFDGNRVLLKSSSVAKFYRNMKSLVRLKARRASKSKNPNDRRIFKSNIYKRFGHLGQRCENRNYLSYAYDASEIMQTTKIRRQVSRAWRILQKEIVKQENHYRLLK